MRRLLGYGLLGLFLLLAAALLWTVLSRQPDPVPPGGLDGAEATSERPADLVLQDVDYTETREGRRQWNLKAIGAQYNQEFGETLAQDVRMVIFDAEEKDHIYLTARHGKMLEKSNLIEVWGDVVIKTVEGESCRTERLVFNSRENRVTTDQPVKLTSPGRSVTGVGMVFDLASERFQLQRKVRAVLHSDLILGK